MRILHGIIPLALAAAVVQIPTPAHAQISIGVSIPGFGVRVGPGYAPGYGPGPVPYNAAITIAPPPLPDYDQPYAPGPGFLWTPGYWAYDPADGYYWVPGTWVQPPEVGLLWTPGYWGWNNGFYRWNDGYWGDHVGFYGGVNYGWGYFGDGYAGGRWDGGVFRYNGAYNRFNGWHPTNVYNERVTINNNIHISYNGGNGGIDRRPTPQEQTFTQERHIQRTQDQVRNFQAARSNPEFRESVNHGAPAVAAVPRAGDFHGQGVVMAHGATDHPAPATDRPAPATDRPVTNDVQREAPRPNYQPPARSNDNGGESRQVPNTAPRTNAAPAENFYQRPARQGAPSYGQPQGGPPQGGQPQGQQHQAAPQQHAPQGNNNEHKKNDNQ